MNTKDIIIILYTVSFKQRARSMLYHIDGDLFTATESRMPSFKQPCKPLSSTPSSASLMPGDRLYCCALMFMHKLINKWQRHLANGQMFNQVGAALFIVF